MDSSPFKCLNVYLPYFCWFIIGSFLPPSPLPILLLCLSLSIHISFVLPVPFETELCYVAQAGLEQVLFLPPSLKYDARVLAPFSLCIHVLGSGGSRSVVKHMLSISDGP